MKFNITLRMERLKMKGLLSNIVTQQNKDIINVLEKILNILEIQLKKELDKLTKIKLSLLGIIK